jgi:hypothetical protein
MIPLPYHLYNLSTLSLVISSSTASPLQVINSQRLVILLLQLINSQRSQSVLLKHVTMELQRPIENVETPIKTDDKLFTIIINDTLLTNTVEIECL